VSVCIQNTFSEIETLGPYTVQNVVPQHYVFCKFNVVQFLKIIHQLQLNLMHNINCDKNLMLRKKINETIRVS
jgi:hypothetical protein